MLFHPAVHVLYNEFTFSMQAIAIGTSVLQRYTKSLDLTRIKGDKITNEVIVELGIDSSYLTARADF